MSEDHRPCGHHEDLCPPPGCCCVCRVNPRPCAWDERSHSVTLTDFLLARIAEDGRDADDYWEDDYPNQSPEPGSWWHWVLAECEAKRRIVQHYDALTTAAAAIALLPALRLLALPYADHPDYREEWRP